MTINPFDILKNAQKLQEQMGSFQEKLSYITVSGAAGGDMVQIEMNGRAEVLSVRIAPELTGDVEMLQDLVATAFNNAQEKVREAVSRELGTLTGIPGLNIPGFPFGGASS
jgi:DNA-binding YbaB/EbfC family protein